MTPRRSKHLPSGYNRGEGDVHVRKLKACVHIKAPVQTVRELVSHRQEWLVTRGGVLLNTLAESWDAAEEPGGTIFTLQMEYGAKLSFLEPFMGDGFQQSVATSLSRLKQLAENTPSQLH